MTTTVIFKDRMIEMKGTLELLFTDDREEIDIGGQPVATVVSDHFRQYAKETESHLKSYGRFRITIEKLRDKT